MLERNDVDHPLWRKKVDGTLIKDAWTPIPIWVRSIWDIDHLFSDVVSKRDKNGAVLITFMGSTFQGQIAKVKAPNGFRYRLYFDRNLADALADKYVMTFMRVIESELSADKNHRQVEQDISFWEFLDIEFNSKSKTFIFTPYFTVKPEFPNLFSRLVGSAPFKTIASELIQHKCTVIHKQHWKRRAEYKFEIGAKNVVYMLLDSKEKLIYVGEAKELKKRFDSGHPDIRNWDFYKYNVLPSELSDYRLIIERMVIRDMASLLENKQDIPFIKISDFKLANRKIDR
jgi:hypothetical protein